MDQPVISVKEGLKPSYMTQKHIVKGHVKWLGCVSKCSKTYNKAPKTNQSFLSFLSDRNLEKPKGFQMAHLSSDACFKSYAKYDRGQPFLREVPWRRAIAWTYKKYLFMGNSEILDKKVVLTEMDKTSSCGYPGNILFPNKTEFLESASEKLLDDYFKIIGTVNEKQIVALWKVAQKRELISDEKILAGKVRTFTASSVEFSVAANRMFLHQNNIMNNHHVLRTNTASTSFVGATKFAGGWHKLYQKLSKHPNAFELDESSYDSSLFQRAMVAVMEFRWNCLKPEHKTIENRRRVEHLYSSMIHSICVLENRDILVKNTGNPSGSTNTINDNTLILDMLFNYAWLCSCEDLDVETSLQHFEDNVEPVFNGDDNTYTCSDEVLRVIEPRIVEKIWSDIGVITNTPSYASRKVEEVKFLSHGFHWDQDTQKWYPVPEENKILCSLAYASETDDIRWHYLRACALRIESFWNLSLRNLLNSYIIWLDQEFDSKLCGELRGIKMEHIRGLYMTDEQILALYSGKESWSVANLSLYTTALN
jgi:hypothetical protein